MSRTRPPSRPPWIEEGVVYESIASFYDLSGSPRAVPLGFVARGEAIELRIYRGRALESMEPGKGLVLNMTDDSLLFAEALFGLGFARLSFVESRCSGAPRIAEAHAYIDAEVAEVGEGEPATVLLRPLCYEWANRPPRPYTRANSHLIEVLIYATKVRAFAEAGDERSARAAYERIAQSLEIIEKVSRGSAYWEAARRVAEEARRWLSRS
ncbi:MAG: DUF447 domain-containing protein [Desulfurococcaceae archaeon]